MKQPVNLQRSSPLTVRSPHFKLRRSGLRILLGLLALALVVNLGFMFVYGGSSNLPLTARSEQSAQFIALQAIDEQQTIVATLTNQVQLLTNGTVAQQAQFDAPIGGLAYVPTEQTVYVGTADGVLRLLNQALQPTGEIAINRRIVGLQPAADGGVLVANGIGAFSDRYYISHITQGQEKPLWTKRVEFTITDLRVLHGSAIYGTANARVGALDATGEPRWVTPLPSTPTRLLPLEASNRILVGDERGSVTLLADDGSVVWTSSLTPYAIRGLYYDEPTTTYYAGDTQGSVFAFDTSGQKRLTLKAGTSDIEAFLPQNDGTALVIPRNGAWQTLNPQALSGSTQAQTMGWVLAGIDSLLLVGLCIAAVLTVERWYIATPRIWQRFRQSQVSYLMVMPSLILIILFTYYPAAMALYYSFTNFSLRSITRFVGLQNYITIITSDFYFRVGFVNMMLILITSIIKSIAVPLLVAELVFWLRNDVHRYIFRTMFVLPAVVPGLVGTLLWRMVYDPTTGLLNQVLRAVGLGMHGNVPGSATKVPRSGRSSALGFPGSVRSRS